MQLGVSVSSVSVWCRGIQLTDEQRHALDVAAVPIRASAQSRAVTKNREINQARWDNARAEGVRLLSTSCDLQLLLVGLGLYIGDGYKANRACGFSNSNVAIQKFMMSWFEICFGVTRDRFTCRVIIHEKYRDDALTIRDEWCRELGLPESAFRGTTFVTSRRPPPYEERGSYKGTLSLTVRKGGNIFHQILGMADALVYKGSTHRPG